MIGVERYSSSPCPRLLFFPAAVVTVPPSTPCRLAASSIKSHIVEMTRLFARTSLCWERTYFRSPWTSSAISDSSQPRRTPIRTPIGKVKVYVAEDIVEIMDLPMKTNSTGATTCLMTVKACLRLSVVAITQYLRKTHSISSLNCWPGASTRCNHAESFVEVGSLLFGRFSQQYAIWAMHWKCFPRLASHLKTVFSPSSTPRTCIKSRCVIQSAYGDDIAASFSDNKSEGELKLRTVSHHSSLPAAVSATPSCTLWKISRSIDGSMFRNSTVSNQLFVAVK